MLSWAGTARVAATTARRVSRTRSSPVISGSCHFALIRSGKPEPLRHQLGGAWSRRIDETNRLVYLVTDEEIRVLQARYHY